MLPLKDIPADSGLRVAPLGLENTIILDPTPIDPLNTANILDLVCSIELFRNALIRTVKDAVISADKVTYKAGQKVFFYISLALCQRLLRKASKQINST